MKQPILILGGGVAGLSAANRLSERGASVTLIDAGSYPQHKVCGEFLSPEALPILRNWKIPIGRSISQVALHAGRSSLTVRLPEEAGSCARYELDRALAERAARLGCEVRTQTRIEQIIPGELASKPHQVQLSSGETLLAGHLLISTGRLNFFAQPHAAPVMKYVGFKAHFRSRAAREQLDMHSFTNGYLGICSVNRNTVNAACLCALAAFEKAGSPWALIHALQEAHPHATSLQQLQPDQMVFDDWLITRTPALGIKRPPSHAQVICLGDAMGSIYPATGDGLAMAITSGIMAADFALDRSGRDYQKAWRARYASRIQWGTHLHRLFLSPHLGQRVLSVGKRLPGLDRWIYAKTRERSTPLRSRA